MKRIRHDGSTQTRVPWIMTAGLLLLAAAQARADSNVLANPGFEDGAAEWTARNCTFTTVSSPVYGGSRSGRASGRTADWQGIQQNMLNKMVPGRTYIVSGWVRTSTSANSTVRITFQKNDGSNNGEPQYQWAASGTANNSGWTYLSGSYTLNVTGTLTQLLVYVEGPDAGVDIYLDDASVYGPEPDSSSTIDVSTPRQIIEGIGAAGAWYTSTLVNHPYRNTLYDLLFNKLSLDIYRIRNTYEIEPGTLSDTVQIIQQGEAALGRPLKILISAWSPPSYLKKNGVMNGGTLAKDAYGNYLYDEYAQWWADSLDYYASQGVIPDYISIQNEPDYTNSGWHTCQLDATENSTNAGYNLAFEAVWQALNQRMGANMPKMPAPETTGFANVGIYINNLLNPSHVYGYAHHLYNCSDGGEPGCGENPDQYLPVMANFNAQYGGSKPLFQTEYEYLVDTWDCAINTALLMHNSFTVEAAAAYIYWDLFWGSGSGLIQLTSNSYTINPVYWSFKHYSAFIDSGWQRVEASVNSPHLRLSAYISPDHQRLTAVFINTSTGTVETPLSFTGISIGSGQIYRSSATENCILAGTYANGDPVTVPARSIVTLSLTAAAEPDTTPPAVPSGLSVAPGNGHVLLDWNDNTESDLAGYNVYRSTTAGSGYVQLNAALLTASTYTDFDVTNGVTYYYHVTAVDTSDNESDGCNDVGAIPGNGYPRIYNFAGITAADTDYNVYACDVDVFPFAGNSDNLNSMVEATDAQYVSISADNTDEWETANPGSGDEIFLWVEMKVNEPPAAISRIDLTFSGNTDTYSAIFRLYVLRAGADWTQTSSWVQVGSDLTIPPDVDTTLTGSITSDIADYIDASGRIVWGVFENMSSQPLRINYLEMRVVPFTYLTCADVRAGGWGLAADLTDNCYVDLDDLAALSVYWLETDCGPLDNCGGADFEPTDGVVDWADLSRLAERWLDCNDPADAACTPNWP